MQSGIYRIICATTGKFYIGSATSIPYRWRKHREALTAGTHPNRHMQRAWKKYGPEAFCLDVIEYTEAALLLEREQYYLDTLRPYDHTIGFNISHYADSPTRGRKASEETRRRMTATRTGKKLSEETRQKLAEAKRRTPQTQLMTPEARAKRAAAKRGRKHTDATRQKMAESARLRQHQPRHIVTTPEGEELLVHLPSFCREHGLSYGVMTNIICGLQLRHHGYTARRTTN